MIYPEDANYEDIGVSKTRNSPINTRATFGPPPSWMSWENATDFDAGGGEYNGFDVQDANKPYVFYGGGQNERRQYLGPISLICPQTKIPSGLSRDDLNNPDGRRNAFHSIFATPIWIFIKRGTETLKCFGYPSNWPDGVRFSHKHEQIYKSIIDTWSKHCTPYQGSMISIDHNFDGNKYCFRLIDEPANNSISILLILLGNASDWYHSNNVLARKMIFHYPEIVRDAGARFRVVEASYIANTPDGPYMIMKNGDYLKGDYAEAWRPYY